MVLCAAAVKYRVLPGPPLSCANCSEMAGNIEIMEPIYLSCLIISPDIITDIGKIAQFIMSQNKIKSIETIARKYNDDKIVK